MQGNWVGLHFLTSNLGLWHDGLWPGQPCQGLKNPQREVWFWWSQGSLPGQAPEAPAGGRKWLSRPTSPAWRLCRKGGIETSLDKEQKTLGWPEGWGGQF